MPQYLNVEMHFDKQFYQTVFLEEKDVKKWGKILFVYFAMGKNRQYWGIRPAFFSSKAYI